MTVVLLEELSETIQGRRRGSGMIREHWRHLLLLRPWRHLHLIHGPWRHLLRPWRHLHLRAIDWRGRDGESIATGNGGAMGVRLHTRWSRRRRRGCGNRKPGMITSHVTHLHLLGLLRTRTRTHLTVERRHHADAGWPTAGKSTAAGNAAEMRMRLHGRTTDSFRRIFLGERGSEWMLDNAVYCSCCQISIRDCVLKLTTRREHDDILLEINNLLHTRVGNLQTLFTSWTQEDGIAFRIMDTTSTTIDERVRGRHSHGHKDNDGIAFHVEWMNVCGWVGSTTGNGCYRWSTETT